MTIEFQESERASRCYTRCWFYLANKAPHRRRFELSNVFEEMMEGKSGYCSQSYFRKIGDSNGGYLSSNDQKALMNYGLQAHLDKKILFIIRSHAGRPSTNEPDVLLVAAKSEREVIRTITLAVKEILRLHDIEQIMAA